jgi:hypothetical protein
MSFKPPRATVGFRSLFDGCIDGVVHGRRDLDNPGVDVAEPYANVEGPGPARPASYRQMSPRKAQPQVVLLMQHLISSDWQPGHDDELHWQLPLSHTRLFVHACPQEPQLLLSVCSATQAPLQFV